MMNYISVYQPQLIEYWLSINEWLVLDYILKANNWARNISVGNVTYYEVRVWKVLADLPVLAFKTKQPILRIVNRLIELKLLEKIVQENKPYYSPTEKTREYIFSSWKGCVQNDTQVCTKWDTRGVQNNTLGVSKWIHNSNIIYSNIKHNNNNNNNNRQAIINEIYNNYYKKMPSDKKKYTKSAQAKLYIEQLLKTHTKEELLTSANNYLRQTEKTYIMAVQYFYSNTKQGKYYKPFIDYIGEEKKAIDINNVDVGF